MNLLYSLKCEALVGTKNTNLKSSSPLFIETENLKKKLVLFAKNENLMEESRADSNILNFTIYSSPFLLSKMQV